MVALGLLKTYPRDIYTFYLKFERISPSIFQVGPNPQVLFTIDYIGLMAALFPLISAIAHFTIAFPRNERYNQNLQKAINPYRWYEYAFYRETGEGITNTLMDAGRRVMVVGIKGLEAFRSERGLAAAGSRYFGFDIDYVPIEEQMKAR